MNDETPFVSRSQAGQDRWVYDTLVGPEQLFTGTFLDIGCLCEGQDDLVTINNTYALEQLGWRGLLVDVAPSSGAGRVSKFIQADATTLDWARVLSREPLTPALAPSDGARERVTFDYLSLDVDEVTLEALQNLLNHGVRFRCATIEHDAYQRGEGLRNAIRGIMAANGYTLARGDVAAPGRGGLWYPFEDWWVDLKTVRSAECGVRSAAESEVPA